MVKVTYLYHSGFAVELDRHLLIFDYYKGELPKVPEGKQPVIFASHKHQDHFQLSVLKWGEQASANTRYFFGNDIKMNEKYLERKGIDPVILERVKRMHGGECFELPQEQDGMESDADSQPARSGQDTLRVETLRSTDEGVAFLVQAEGISIYHAGDLNHWFWAEEPESWNAQMERDYRAEIDRITGRYFDIAFVPLDPRLRAGYCLGMDYFLKKVKAQHIFPMHMWNKYSVIRQYKETPTGKLFADQIADISKENKEFVIK